MLPQMFFKFDLSRLLPQDEGLKHHNITTEFPYPLDNNFVVLVQKSLKIVSVFCQPRTSVVILKDAPFH